VIERINTNDRMSQIAQHGGMVFLSGQVPADANADIGSQTASVLDKIEALLQEVGTSRADILSATIYLADISDFAEMNAVWDRWFAPGTAPTRTCVEAKLARAEIGVEITTIAAQPNTRQ